jgi:hypothetical protein
MHARWDGSDGKWMPFWSRELRYQAGLRGGFLEVLLETQVFAMQPLLIYLFPAKLA